MNFYKRHLGDLAKSCGDLSQGQMGAYDLLLDWHYGNEKPLPIDKAKLYRIGRAVTKAERENVDSVIAEMFQPTPDGYVQKRALEVMAQAQAQADTNRRIAEEREAKKRARTEHESFNEADNEPCEKREPSHKPLATSQEALVTTTPASSQSLEGATAAGRACRLMKEAGCVRTNPSHPDLLAALAEGVTAEALADTAREAVEAGKTNPFTYAITAARSRKAEGPRLVHTSDRPRPTEAPRNPEGPSPRLSPEESQRREAEALDAMNRQLRELGRA